MYFAGIDIGGSTIKMCVMDENGVLHHEDAIPTITGDPQALADSVVEAFARVGLPYCALGVSTAGRVNRETNLVIASNLKWMRVPFASIIADTARCPVAIDNDVAGALYGEWSVGACQNTRCVAYVALGTGVGGAFLIDGKPFRGFDNTGGEIGHMITHADGKPCVCGGRGCFEQYASATALANMGGRPPEEIFRLAAQGDAAMNHVLDEYAHELAIGLANIAALFRPEMIVLGGGVAQAGQPLLSRVEDELRLRCPSMPTQTPPPVVAARLGNRAGMIGGAMMARNLWYGMQSGR